MTIVVTRHPALIELLRERGVIAPGNEARVLDHASPGDVAGQDVIGVLPLHLAALARSITELPLAVLPEERGQELGLDRLREIAGDPVTYQVTRVPRLAMSKK